MNSERQNNNNKSRKTHSKKIFFQNLICILMSEISIWPLRKHDLVLGDKTLVGNHRGQTFLVVGHQVCTHLRRDFVPLLFADPVQVIKVSRLTFGNSNLQLPPQIFYGIRSGDWLGHSRTLMCFFLSHSFVALAVCFGSLSFWNTYLRPIFNDLAGFNALALTVHDPLMRRSCPVTLAEKHPQSIMFPLPCLTVGMVFVGS